MNNISLNNCMCVCVCMCVYVRVCVCMCVYVRAYKSECKGVLSLNQMEIIKYTENM